jgi:hypothetical protein
MVPKNTGMPQKESLNLSGLQKIGQYILPIMHFLREIWYF